LQAHASELEIQQLREQREARDASMTAAQQVFIIIVISIIIK